MKQLFRLIVMEGETAANHENGEEDPMATGRSRPPADYRPVVPPPPEAVAGAQIAMSASTMLHVYS